MGIHTFGCRLNQFESDGIISRFLAGEEFALVDAASGPDVAIINTCTVTDQADSRNRALIRKIKRANPHARVVLTGCQAQTNPEALASIPGVHAVVGNDHKTQLHLLLEDRGQPGYSAPEITAKDLEEGIVQARVYSSGPLDAPGKGKRPVLSDPFAYGDVFPVEHSRAYLKIQDGCDRRCSYCKIPRARGGGVSRSFSEILNHVERLNEGRIPEIVLTGVNPGWYRDSGHSFNELIRAILDKLDYSRLRLSSIEPCDVDEELAELSLHPSFCNYFHVPLQSGSRDILRMMRRTYSADSYRKRMETVLRVNPDVFLGTDVICGFPGESEAHFNDTVDLISDLDIIQIHGFPYSPREGTDALHLPGAVDRGVAKERVRRLQQLSKLQWQSFVLGLQGKVRWAVIEDPERGIALSDDYARFEFDPAMTSAAGDPSKLQGRLGLFEAGPPGSTHRSVQARLVRLKQ